MKYNFPKETTLNEAEVIHTIREESYLLHNEAELEPLFTRIGDARIVMLGEATHGTHEFYTWRNYITRRLIDEKGFSFVAVEGDWPDCYKLNRFVKGYDTIHSSAFKILHSFNRWPTWMWANWETVSLADWMYKHNLVLQPEQKVGFFGLDVYGLWESMENILQYLRQTDINTFKLAEEAFHCFEPYWKDEGKAHTEALRLVPQLCEDEVVNLLKSIREKLPVYSTDHENALHAEQNSVIAVNAEKYYRAMMVGGAHSWNIRERHMADTLERLLEFHGPESKAIIWAHNTHIGDARATNMIEESMFNIGELTRIKHHEKGVVLVGFGSYEGTVMAGNNWRAPVQVIQVPEAKKGSWEWMLHQAGKENKLLLMDDFSASDQLMEHHIGHRAIGVVYQPHYEKFSSYVPTILPLRYDAFIYFNETRALYPLHTLPDVHLVPETYPFGV